MRVSKIMNNGRRKWFYTLWSWQCAGCCAFFWYAWVLKYEMIILCPHSLMFPLCFNVSVFRPCACVILWPSSSILLSLYWLIPVAIGCLLCVWVIYCGDNIFYIKKEYCGLLGGLTFYRTRHICKSDKVKKKKKTLPFSCTGHVQNRSLFVGYVPFSFSFITFWYMLLGGLLYLAEPLEVVYLR